MAGLSGLPTGFLGIASTRWIATGTLILVSLIRRTDHGGLEDRGMAVQDGLDLLGIDVLAAADDHVLDPVDDPQVAVGVEDADVAGVQPAVAERVGGRLWPVQVPLHHVRA